MNKDNYDEGLDTPVYDEVEESLTPEEPVSPVPEDVPVAMVPEDDSDYTPPEYEWEGVDDSIVEPQSTLHIKNNESVVLNFYKEADPRVKEPIKIYVYDNGSLEVNTYM